MKQSRHTLEQIFQTQVDNLSLTLQPFTVVKYQYVARYFVAYLRAEFPEIRRLSQLRRDPHMLGFFRWLCELRPPIGNPTRRQRLLCLRRLLNDLAAQGHQLQPGLIIPEDLPTLPEYLPRPLSPEDDHRLQDELRRNDNLYSNALLLTRLTGIRIGECIHLPLDCLRQIGPEQWALHVPLGKLHTERLVPLDSEGLRLLKRIQELRAMASPGSSGEIQRLPPASSGRSLCVVSNAARGAGRCRQTSRLHRQQTYLASPPAAHLGHGTAQLWNWAASPHEVDGAQKYSDDPSVFEGHPARLTTRVLPGTPKFTPNLTAFPRSPSPPLLQICLASAKRSRRHAIYWKCIDGNSPMTRPAAVYSGSITGFWTSLNNFRTSPAREK